MNKLIQISIAATLIALALFGGAGTALAAGGSTNDCTVWDIGIDEPVSGAPRITLHCLNDGSQYTTNYPSCGVVTPDTVRLWTSMIVTATVTSRKLNIYWDDTCGTRAIGGLYVASNL